MKLQIAEACKRKLIQSPEYDRRRKISEDNMVLIEALLKAGAPQKLIAKHFGVSASYISVIKRGKTEEEREKCRKRVAAYRAIDKNAYAATSGYKEHKAAHIASAKAEGHTVVNGKTGEVL